MRTEDGREQVPLWTGSFSGYRPLQQLGQGYLTATEEAAQAFCGNEEGWGPLSPYRWDFSPCFVDVWVATVAVFGIVCGALALWHVLSKNKAVEVSKGWHFWTKQTLLGLVAADVTVQLLIQMVDYGGRWYRDFRVLTTFLVLLSLAVVFAIQWLEHGRVRNANGVVLFYWLLLLVAYTVKVRSLVSQQVYASDRGYFVTFAAGLGLAAAAFVSEWFWPRQQAGYEVLVGEDGEECPEQYSTIFSRLTFSWMTPMMKYGYKQYLTEQHLWALGPSDRTWTTGHQFEKAWEYERAHKTRPSFWLALFRAYGGPYTLAAAFKVGNDISAFIQPQLLRYLIAFVESYGPGREAQPVIKGVSIALGMFLVACVQTAMIHQYFQLTIVTGMRIKSGLASAIYKKSLRLSNEGRSARATGDIVNYMAVDAQRLQDLTQFLHSLWSAPFQITLCMLSLYQLVGWSMLAGVGVMIVMIPVNGFIARFMKRLQKQQMKNKDARSRLIAEIINNMKSIKLYAWSTAFMNKLNYVRNDLELANLRRIGAAQAMANFTWSTTPFLVSCSTFALFVWTGKAPLSTDIVFPALALFNLLGFPLAMLPMVISSLVEASVAVGRLTDFLTAEEIQPDAITVGPAAERVGDESVVIRNATFSWNRHEAKSVLRDIQLTAHKGELTCIVGRVGAGKSSLLQSMLGDLWKESGSVQVNGSVAYVAQQPWIMNGTVRDNIVFGCRWDAAFYDRTVSACALDPDFAQLPDGDGTLVGERGISLSGGQKARVALARAVFARADIYLLDDPLSAVDSHVAKHMVDNILGPKGLLATKCRILATNAIPVLVDANFICQLKDGEMVERGTYQQLMAMKGGVSDLIRTLGQESGPLTSNSAQESGTGSGSGTRSGSGSGSDSDASTAVIEPGDTEEAREGLPELEPIKLGSTSKRQRRRDSQHSTTTLRRASTASFRHPGGKLVDEEATSSKTKQVKEHMEQGKVKWDVYLEYARTSNLGAVTCYLFALVAAQTAQIGGSVWLKNWAERNSSVGANPEVGKYLAIYFAIGLGSSALTVVQTLILWILCSIEASRKLHERMATAIFRSPMSFFDTTPAGRILNRFSSDIYKLDEVLARTFNMLFVNLARSVSTLVVISVGTPAFTAMILPLAGMYYWVQRYYLRTSRELKRLDSVSRSPIYAHFQESLGGVSTIRAYGRLARFEHENEWRVDSNMRAYYPSISVNRWLAIRLEFIGAVVILAAALLSILSVINHSGLSAGMVGLAMSYALQITTSLNWIVRQTVEVETNIVSVERVLEYARLPSEAAEIVHRHRPPVSWPSDGAVEFHNFSTRYRPGLDLVLKNIKLAIRAHEKIGVVGRTGAGKSSLTLALFRIIEPDSGHISIDQLDTSTIGLLDLRRRLAIIPQDAALFQGTVRDNLDPGHVHDDTELWSVLDHARLKEHVSQMDGGLGAQISEGGSNLSQGQRQLISLARAMLTPSNILVLDEATAAVDVETDAMLQSTLRSPLFSHRTIITVAHRINTILDSDRVVVLDRGEVAEFDRPRVLLERRDGLFYGLVKQAGLLDSAESG